MRARHTFVAAVAALAISACGDKPSPSVADYTPTETPEQFQARRDAEVARAVAQARASRQAAEEAQRAAEAEQRKAAIEHKVATMQAKLVAALKDPESARITGAHLGQSGDTLCGHVNARNSFGGFTGDKRFVVSGDAVLVDSDDSRVMVQAIWNAEGCHEK